MPLELNAFAAARPYLYHLTDSTNLPGILACGRLSCTERLLTDGGRSDLLDRPRRGMTEVQVDGRRVAVRDQDPLHAGNIEFEAGWTFARFVRHLNRYVFFWPGTVRGPNDYGVRHFARYRRSGPVLIRIPFTSVVDTGATPLFCRFNSGSPRCSRGLRSPRGSRTFLLAGFFGEGAQRVVEVVFEDSILLPGSIESATDPAGPWQPLFVPER